MTEYVVFSYKSGRFANSLGSGYSPRETCLNSRVSINNIFSLILEHAVLLIFKTFKGTEMGHVMLQ